WPIGDAAAPVAWLQLGVGAKDLAVSVRVNDSKAAQAAAPWEGSCVEVFAAGSQGGPISQFFLLPRTADASERALRAEGMVQVPEPRVRVHSAPTAATSTSPQGYELSALIPLDLLAGIDPAAPFLVDIAVSAVAGPAGKYVREILDGNPRAYCDASGYVRVVPAKA
ncbi:MAG: hypothetical protein NTW19_23935, partial [Planctomycetota bacterium]|nr:hypothetical protein [Planctomycetota bacterium]